MRAYRSAVVSSEVRDSEVFDAEDVLNVCGDFPESIFRKRPAFVKPSA